jgi:glutathione S-transferase
MKLYFSPGACSLSPHITLKALNIACETERVDLAKKLTAGGQDYWKISPKGSVPALLLDNGELLTEGAVITQYLADLKPDTGYLPKFGSWERYRSLEWLNFIATDLHKGFSPLWGADRMYKDQPAVATAVKEATKLSLARQFKVLAETLSKQDFLMGPKFTAPDAYLTTVLSWVPMVKWSLADWPALAAYVERCQALPFVREAMKDEGLLR